MSARRFAFVRAFSVLEFADLLDGVIIRSRNDFDGERAAFVRFRDDFLSPLVFLVTLESLDEPIVDGGLFARRRLTLAAGRLLARSFALFVLSSPECLSNPIVAR
ncbi:MAG: hypothetical protein FJX15_04565 [Alphaproteobacteria bacterium]|nr:hypothetical protein [Alphaproteobacteria bacterium]